MKKSLLLTALLLAALSLAGCNNPDDITDDLASIAALTVLA